MDPQDPRPSTVPDGTAPSEPAAHDAAVPADPSTAAAEPSSSDAATPEPAEPSSSDAATPAPGEPGTPVQPPAADPVAVEPPAGDAGVAESPNAGPVAAEPTAAATVPAATEPAATEPAATEPAATEPAATEPAATEPAATEPAATVPAATVPAATVPVTPAPEPVTAPAVPAAVVPPPTTPAGPAPSAADGAPSDADVDPDADQDPDAEPAPPRRGGALAVLPLVLLSLGALLLAAGTAFLALQVRDANATDEAREEALAASRDAARVLFSYNHETLEDDFSKGLAVTTGPFREEYSNTTQNVVKDVATQYQAVVRARVNEAGVISASPDEVVTLVFLNQVTTSTRVEGEKIDQSRVRMRLVEKDGDWLVDKVDAL